MDYALREKTPTGALLLQLCAALEIFVTSFSMSSIVKTSLYEMICIMEPITDMAKAIFVQKEVILPNYM